MSNQGIQGTELKNTLGMTTYPSKVEIPKSILELKELLLELNKENKKFKVVSTGRNWGYGSQISKLKNYTLISLKNLKKICDYNDITGTVTIGPGVTSQELFNFLEKVNSPYMPPVVGAGPDVSIIGNMLEKGFSLNRNSCHADMLISQSIMLPSGTSVNSRKSGSENHSIIGPELKSLLPQASIGIVTSATIKLKKRPEKVSVYKLEFKNMDELKNGVETLSQIYSSSHGFVTPCIFMNQERFNSSKNQMGQNEENFPWHGVFTVSSESTIHKAIKKYVSKKLKKQKISFKIISDKLINFLELVSKYKYYRNNKIVEKYCKPIITFRDYIKGKPTYEFLNIVYVYEANTSNNPDKDDVGLIWYSPILPNSKNTIETYINNLIFHFNKFDFPKRFAFIMFNQNLIESTIPIIFKKNKNKVQAEELWDNLFNENSNINALPYRLPSSKFQKINDILPKEYIDLLNKIKKSVDDKMIFDPTRS